MEDQRTYDLFISHAWRYHDSWVKLVDLLDEIEGFTWRNFSVPWHDPAKHPSTPDGAAFIREWLQAQIKPAIAMILLADVYEIRSARKWLDFQIDYARKNKIPIIVVQPEGATLSESDCTRLGDRAVDWNVGQLVDVLREEAKIREG